MNLFSWKKNKKQQSDAPQAVNNNIDFAAFAGTDVGSVRDHNEDNLVFIRPFDPKIRNSHGCLAIIADGMGGHNAGEVASQMAIDRLSRFYFDQHTSIKEALTQSFERTNREIFQRAQKRVQYKGMGTTCTAVVLRGQEIYVGHVGDSRAYLLKGDRLVQLSKDHTYVQFLLDSGKISPKEAESHPDRNVITQAMGTSAKIKPDISKFSHPVNVGDKVLVCSDGLYEYISEQEFVRLLQSYSIQEAANVSIDLAKKRGGHDNISVLVIEAIEPKIERTEKATQKLSTP